MREPEATFDPVARCAIKTEIAATRAAIEPIRIKVVRNSWRNRRRADGARRRSRAGRLAVTAYSPEIFRKDARAPAT
jgi:hypothetical protein